VPAIDRFDGEYEFLSNFYPSWVELDGQRYVTVEHAYQAAKTLDSGEREAFQRTSDPGRAKRMGRRLRLRRDWESVKVDVMWGLLRQKFSPGTELAARLLATGDAELVEGNTWEDDFWGVYRGKGQNWLGRLLMEVREEIRGQ
jgi:ribA/ribD-fused uncharacterized protein